MNRWNDSLHGGLNSGTLKVISPILSGCDQKWAWSFISRDSKVWYILKVSIGIELIFYMLTVIQWYLVRPTSYSISLTFKCQSIAGVLVRHLAVAEMILWNRGLSVPPSCHLSGCSLRIGLLYFSEFWHGTRYIYEVVRDRARASGKNSFGKMDEK